MFCYKQSGIILINEVKKYTLFLNFITLTLRTSSESEQTIMMDSFEELPGLENFISEEDFGVGFEEFFTIVWSLTS